MGLILTPVGGYLAWVWTSGRKSRTIDAGKMVKLAVAGPTAAPPTPQPNTAAPAKAQAPNNPPVARAKAPAPHNVEVIERRGTKRHSKKDADGPLRKNADSLPGRAADGLAARNPQSLPSKDEDSLDDQSVDRVVRAPGRKKRKRRAVADTHAVPRSGQPSTGSRARCRYCGGFAMAGDTVCYDCNSG